MSFVLEPRLSILAIRPGTFHPWVREAKGQKRKKTNPNGRSKFGKERVLLRRSLYQTVS
jgi:hypothetical protein